MEISGVVVNLLAQQSGQGKNGVWKKQEFILETPGQYPKKFAFLCGAKKWTKINSSVGDKITASINIESREYNGRWYTDVRAWKIQKDSGQSSQDSPPPAEDNFVPDNSGTR